MSIARTSQQKIEKLKEYLKNRDDIVRFDEPNFIKGTTKIVLVDKDFGEFETCYRSLINDNKKHPKRSSELRKATNIKKYGFEYPQKNKDIREKANQTNLKKYGCINVSQNKEIQNKIAKKVQSKSKEEIERIKEKYQQTNLKKFKENPELAHQIKEKRKKTNLEKYGGHPLQNKNIYDKLRQTNLRKYGYDNPSKNKKIQEKIKQTNFEKYGGHPSLTDQVKIKKYQTNLKKYGGYPLQNKEIKEKIKYKYLKEYGIENISQREDIKIKKINMSLDKYGVKNHLQLPNIKEKIKKTNLVKYGYEYPMQNEKIFEKLKKTNLEKYGAEYAIQNKSIKNKGIITHYRNINSQKGSSKTELEIKKWLISIKLNPQKYSIMANEIDLYIEEKRIGIEYNGLYWHSEKKRHKNYHLDKVTFYKTQGIRIINIWEHWWRDRQEQVKIFLKYILSIDINIIPFEEVIAKEINYKIASEFIVKYNIKYPTKCSKLAIGLYYKDNLIGVASLSTHYKYQDRIVLNRFCYKDGFMVVNGIKIISEFASKYFMQDIYVWIDRCITEGNDFIDNGWIKEKIVKTQYFYFLPGRHYSVIKKNKPGKLIDKAIKVWNCGKYILKYPFIQFP